ncbi:FG-GAP-like repeat-containing protein, partial [Planctomycetota bacterium]|nr:FG-GAP-like repeat-containing protein [Planctomycetota bacterium]
MGADGDVDLVVCFFGSGCEAQLIEKLGGGAFAPPVLLDISPKTIDTLDIDGDGDRDVDLVTAFGFCFGGSGRVTFHENDGTGGFLPAVDLLRDGGSHCGPNTRLGDLDGDGDLDVLVLDQGFLPIFQLVRNDGPGRFAGERFLYLGYGAYGCDVFAGDLDVDGDPDLLLMNWSGGAVVWSEGDGYGSLPPARAPSPPYRFDGAVPSYRGRCAPPADVDGDLDLDLLWTRELSSGLHELSFRPNLALEDCDGDGTSDRDQIALDPQLDVNGDGVLDRCQLSLFDCNQNGVFDPLEVGSGASTDANGDRILDECQAIGQTYCTSSGGEASLLPSMLAVGSDAV